MRYEQPIYIQYPKGVAVNPAEPNKPAHPREPAARPSLFSESAPAREPHEAHEEQTVSILSSLGPGAKSGQGKSRQALFAGIATVAVVVGATVWFMPEGQHASEIIASNPEVKFAAASPAAAPPVSEPTMVAAPSAVPMTPEPAQIETVKNPEPVSSDTKSTGGLAGLLPATDAPKDTSTKTASINDEPVPEQPAAPVKETKPKIAKSKAPEPIVHANATPTRPIKVAIASTSKPAPSRSVTPVKKAEAARDSDVALLEALVAYSEKADAKFATREPSPKRVAAPFNPKREVVMPKVGLTTGELVNRCRTLGFLESMLCRQRICSDLWGKDPACPGSTFSAN